jgi:prefoldin subunit 5|tara:strand:- start:423 stop:581 length:159 start_codon:yes stop_codon:yes gene_type:complete
MAMTTDSAVASLQADLTALRAENKELTERLNQLEAAAEASGAAQGPLRRAEP